MKPNYPLLLTWTLITVFTNYGLSQETEPNNTIATADALAEGVVITGDVGPGDGDDYFSGVPSDDGTVTMYISYTNNSGSPGADLFIQLLNANGSSLTSKSLTNVPLGSTFMDSLVVPCRAVGTHYFRVSSTSAFDYSVSFNTQTAGQGDLEPNNSFNDAIFFASTDTASGRVGYNSTSTDGDDYYYSILPDDGTLKVYVDYTNTSGGSTEDFYTYVYNKGQSQIGYSAKLNQYPGVHPTDTITIYCRQADTVFFRINSVECASYSLRYEVIPSGQADIEPNNDIAHATYFSSATTISGRVGYNSVSTDQNDYYYSVLPNDGTLKVYVDYTNTSGGSTEDFYTYVYNKAQSQIGYSAKINQYPGAHPTDTITIYCRQADTVFFRINSVECASYSLRYEVIPSGQADIEPNNDIAHATFFASNQTISGRVGYTSVGTDVNDYYYSVLPDDGTLKVYVDYINTSGGSTEDFYTYVYNKAQSQIEYSAKLNQDPGVHPTDTITIYCRQADTVFFRINSVECASYSLHYEVVPSGQADAEPNDAPAQASYFASTDTVYGRVGYSSVGVDLNDYYYSVLPQDGTLKIYVNHNNTTGGTSADFAMYVYDKNQTNIGSLNRNNQARGAAPTDTITINCRKADTVYFRVNANECFSYNFSYKMEDTEVSDPEPNNALAQAALIDLNDTTKGNIGHSSISYDATDYFKFYNSGYSKIRWYFSYSNTTGNSSPDLTLYTYNPNGSQRDFVSLSNRPIGPGMDTSILFNCAAQDTFYLRVQAGSGCFTYSFDFGLVNGTYYKDMDNDNYGDPDSSVYSCVGPPPGYVAAGGDCNDNDNSVHPNASEVCDGVDNNCNGQIDEGIYTSSSNAAICQGDSILIGGEYRSIAGTYIDTTIIVNGCDSISVVHLSLYPTDTTYLFANTNNPGAAGVFTDTLSNQYGCDSLVITTITYVAPPPMDTLRITEIMYNPPESGTDSLEYVEIYNAGNNAVNLNGYSLNDGVGYTFGSVMLASHNYVVVCKDSMAIYHQFGMSGYQWSGTLSNSGESVVLKDDIGRTLDSVSYSNSGGWPTAADGGGPSIVICDLTVDQNNGANWKASASGTGIMINGNELKGSPGSQDQACAPCIPDSTYISSVTCDSTMAGTTTMTFTNKAGCDSVITTTLTYDPGSVTTLSPLQFCDGDSVAVFGMYQKLAGTYYDTLANSNGCDSIIEQVLIKNPVYHTNLPDIRICYGDSALLFGVYRNTTGIYHNTMQSMAGCDSVISQQLIVDSLIHTMSDLSVCNGDSVWIFGQYRSAAGAYSDTNQSAAGCDSVHTVNLKVLPLAYGNTVASICSGDSILLGGAYQHTAGAYVDTLQAANGCDSLVTTNLNILPVATVNVSDSICPGDSLMLGGAYQSAAGTYTDIYTASNGCDSIVNTTLVIRDSANCTFDSISGSALVLVSDSSWSLSTVVTTATANNYPWPGVMSVPAAATFTLPVMVGQPYPWKHLYRVDSSEVITALGGVTYYRKTFEMVDPNGIKARFRMFVDDDMEIFINGHWIALEDGMGPENWRTANHDLLFNGDGTYINGYMGGDQFDYVTYASLDTIFQIGTNSLVLAIRNRTSKPDRGGFSFRMDLDKGAAVLVPKSSLISGNLAKGILVYPNPTDGVFTVSLNQQTERGEIQLFDLNGKLLQRMPVRTNAQLDLSSYPKGVYLIKVTSGSYSWIQKVIRN